jgi:ATP-dependent DNA helicase RecQ
MNKQPEKILKNVFGFDSFKPLQREIIANVLARRDTLVIMPTGGGKSLCYQIPALIFDGLTVVVSPLISLMKDQVEQLQDVGVPAVFLNSSLSYEEYQKNVGMVVRKEARLLYVAPETLLTPKLFALLGSLKVDCLTIDEAHCISEWGHDFRPEYRQLVDVREKFPSAVCIALTATATKRVREDIKRSLRFESSNEFIASFNRENLFLEIVPKEEPVSQTIRFIQKFPEQSGIIYCFSRRQVDDLALALQNRGFSALPYHAGLSDEERKKNQDAFIHDEVQIIVATIAFGMGINKPNVRFIVHFDLPQNIESYYQQIGRSGRDGLRAHCLLLFSYADVQKIKYLIGQKEESEQLVAKQHLTELLRFAEADVCRRLPLLSYFGETYAEESCGMCDNCLAEEKTLVDITTPALMFLSCVKRTGELFGAGHIIDVLLGAQNEKVEKFSHQNLSTYGIGKELTKKQWQRLSRQVIQKGFLHQEEKYGSLKLTQKAYDLFKNREPVFGVIEEERSEPAVKQSGGRGRTGEPDYDAGLFDLLRRKRKELADEARVPPYIVFSDRSLMEMAAYFPMSPESFREMNGVGSAKLSKYGDVFIDLIRAYCQEHNLHERSKSGQRSLSSHRELQKPRYVVVGEAFNAGQTIEDLMLAFGVQKSTIIDNLVRYHSEGNELRRDGYLSEVSASPEQQAFALQAFERLGAEYLRPVFDVLNEAVSFEDLKLLRLDFLSGK